MWSYKTYFVNDREYFEYDPMGMRSAATQREFPFLESLLRFAEMAPEEWEPFLRQAADSAVRGDGNAAQMALGELAGLHIYFQLPYLKWNGLYTRMAVTGEAAELPIDELRRLPEQLTQLQKEIQLFFDQVLDIDRAGREARESILGQTAFRFRPIPISFERVDGETYAEVLYPNDIRDLVDFSLRTCVRQNILVRRCKNCGRYFALTGRVSAEYCGRPNGGKPLCREIGAFQQWTKGKADDPVFKEYRREYKRRFAWIKAGKLTAEEFYLWSEQARAKKKACDDGTLSLEAFKAWLKQS